MDGPAWLNRSSRFFWLLFLLPALFFMVIAAGSVDRSCLDAADSAYLASAAAIWSGMVPYRDFLLAHPPLLYLLGAPLAALGPGVTAFRLFSIALQVLLGFMTMLLALRLTGNRWLALLAGVFALLAPVGIFFSRTFLNDSLASLLAVSMLWLILGGSRRWTLAAAVAAVAGTLAKLTFVPVLAVGIIYVLLFNRRQARLYLLVSLGGGAAAALATELITGGAYFSDILGSQASKGYGLANLTGGLARIWQYDWPLILLAALGILFVLAGKRRRHTVIWKPGRLFLLLGWLAAGLIVLATLPAEGHDINLFQMAEPAVALLAALAILELTGRGRPAAILAAALVLIALPLAVNRDLSFLARSNAADVENMLVLIGENSAPGEPVLAPGCVAFQAERPVALDYFDQFLWEEKYRRGDPDAKEMIGQLRRGVSAAEIAAVVLTQGQPTLRAIEPGLSARYRPAFSAAQWPPLTLWLPDGRPGASR